MGLPGPDIGNVGFDAYTRPDTGNVIPVRDLFVSFLFNNGEHLLSNTFAFKADRTFMFGSDAVSFQMQGKS